MLPGVATREVVNRRDEVEAQGITAGEDRLLAALRYHVRQDYRVMTEELQENMRAAMTEHLRTIDQRYAQSVEVRELRDDGNRLADALRQLQSGGQQQMYALAVGTQQVSGAIAPPFSIIFSVPVFQLPRSGQQVQIQGVHLRGAEVDDGSYTMLRPSRYGGPSFPRFAYKRRAATVR